MKERKRNKFIVSKALMNFVAAAVLTAAATQLAHTADSMIVGHIVGQDAVSAINMVLPFVEVLNCMGFLICFGANAMCAQAIGSGDKNKVAKTRSEKMSDENIGKEEYKHLGLRLVTNIIPDISYKYMYGQNTVFIHKNFNSEK